ncbi:MAG: cell division protein FtsQ/DivIB [Trueperaceae bacterium]
MRTLQLVLLFVLVALVAVSRFWPSVDRLEVLGHEHLSRTEVLRLANLAPGDPFLWVTRFRTRALLDDPWVLQARVTRHWPDTVAVAVWERVPVLFDGTLGYAADGTSLPGVEPDAAASLPRLEGWGTPRLDEALELLGMLGPREPRVITYGPEGFEVVLADAVLFTPSVDALRAQWSAFESQRGSRVSVYPWGVSSAP